MELSQLYTSSGFFQKHNFLERQKAKVPSRDAPRDFFRSCWAFFSDQSSSIVSTKLTVLQF